MKKKTTKPAALTIEEKIEQRERQIKTALNEIVDTIEKYFTVAPFQWIKGPAEEVGCHSGFPNDAKTPFNRFDNWFDYWLGELFPEGHEAQRQLDSGTDDGSAPGELAFAAQSLGFLCGLLVGSKSMGATRDQLLKQCDGYILPTMKWERWRITKEAEKAAA
jgi:hypothetical protein